MSVDPWNHVLSHGAVGQKFAVRLTCSDDHRVVVSFELFSVAGGSDDSSPVVEGRHDGRRTSAEPGRVFRETEDSAKSTDPTYNWHIADDTTTNEHAVRILAGSQQQHSPL